MKKNSVERDLPTLFKFHSDKGQGWLEVPYSALTILQIEEAISKNSYLSGLTVYLDETIDTPTFIGAWLQYQNRNRNDIDFFRTKCELIKGRHSSFIRRFKRFFPR
jgi:hypothetical protein